MRQRRKAQLSQITACKPLMQIQHKIHNLQYKAVIPADRQTLATLRQNSDI